MKTVAECGLESESRLLTKAFGRYLAPSLISLLFCQIAPFVDALCVSYALGEEALSAVGIITPVYYIINIIAALGGIGGSIAISHCNGAGTPEKAGGIFTRAFIFVLAGGVLVTVLGLLFLRPLTIVLGGLPENMDYALAYFQVLLPGMPFYALCFAGTYFLTNDNAPKLAMCGTIVSNTVNIIIDVLFVIVWDCGIAAAAWGTIIGEMACCLVYGLHFLRRERLCFFDFSTSNAPAKLYPIIKNGIPEAVKYLLFFAQLWVSNYTMKEFGGVAGLADAALIANLLLLSVIIIEGISEPVIPLTANLFGENNQSGVLQVKRIAARFSLWLMLPFTLSFLIYPMWFPRLFCITDPEVLEIMPAALRITAASFPFSCLNLIIINSCVSSNMSRIALEGIVFRILVLLIPCTFLFYQVIPAHAPWLANLVAEVGTFVYFVAFRREGKGLFRLYRENLAFAAGGLLSRENLAAWKKDIFSRTERRYAALAEKAFFGPLARTLEDGRRFLLSFSLLDQGEKGRSLVMRFDSKRDMLYPAAKNGFLVEEQFSLQRRMINMLPVAPEAAGECVVIVAPECHSGKRLVECAREAGNRVVLCVAVPAALREQLCEFLVIDECVGEKLCDRVIIRDTWQELAEELKATESNVAAVIPGSEFGVESAEHLAQAMHVRGNPPESGAARRNKYAMKQAIAAAGLDHARGGRFARLEEALAYVDRELEFPLYIKPPEGAGSVNVFKCENREDFIEKFNLVLTAPDGYLNAVAFVVVEECIDGEEYAVNIFGDDEKILVTSIWKYEKISNEFADNLYWNDFLMDINGPQFDALKEYAVKLYKAVGIKLGPGHAEIKLSRRGPVAIEIGARLMGSANETYTQIGTKIDTPLETLKVFKTGKSDMPSRPALYEHLGLINLPFTQSGKIIAIHGLEKIRLLPGYFTEEMPIKPGDRIEPSLNLDMITCGIWLRTDSHKQLLDEQAKIHEFFRLDIEEDIAH